MVQIQDFRKITDPFKGICIRFLSIPLPVIRCVEVKKIIPRETLDWQLESQDQIATGYATVYL